MITLTVYDPSGNIIYKPNVTYDDQGTINEFVHTEFAVIVRTIITATVVGVVLGSRTSYMKQTVHN